jgi:O-antigen/teichoic acid export membrane protein
MECCLSTQLPIDPHVSRKALIMMTWLVMTTHILIFGQMLILTRSLGPEVYGLMTSALVYQNYLFLFACSGIRAVTIREGILHPDAYDQVVTGFLAFTCSFSMILCLVSMLGACLLEIQADVRLLVWLLAVGNIAGSMNVLPLFDIHHYQVRSAAITLAAEFIAVSMFALLAINGSIGLIAVGIVFLSKWILNFGVHSWVYQTQIRPLRLRFDRQRVKAMLFSSWPLLWSTVIATVPFSAGVFFLSVSGVLEEVAMLGLAQQAAASYLLLTTAALRFFQPRLAQAIAARMPMRRIIVAYASFAFLLLMAMIGAAFLLTHFVLDDRYLGAFVPMIVMLVGAFLHSLGSVGGSYLMLCRMERHVLVAHVVGAGSFLGAGYLVMAWAGAVDFAILSCAAALLSTLVVICFSWWAPQPSGR